MLKPITKAEKEFFIFIFSTIVNRMTPLDNPVWYALNGIDSHFNEGNTVASYFPADVSPFAGLPDWREAMQKTLYDQLPADRSYSAMVAEPIQFSTFWETRFSTTLHQMLYNTRIPAAACNAVCRPLNPSHIPAMLTLTAITKPGPFLKRTFEFGNYYGVFEEEKLVAMAGERLHLTDYTEISAVCTDPDHTGKGYAAFLVSFLADQMLKKGKKPFLHVKHDNQRAINMYQRLGFLHRSDMYFTVFKRR